MVYKFFSGVLVESYGTWLLLQLLDDDSKDSDIPKNVPFAFAINNRNNRFGPGRRNLYSIYLPILEIKVLPAIVCLEGHNIASMHSKRFWSRLDTGDNIFLTLPRRFSSARLGSRRVRLHADDGHRTCATEGFSPPPLSRLSLTFRDASTNVRPQVPPWSNCQDSVHDLSHDQPAIPRHPATLRREHKDFLRPKSVCTWRARHSQPPLRYQTLRFMKSTSLK